MASYLSAALLMAFLLSPSSATDNESAETNKDIVIAEREMQRANYFTFVTLINMVQDKVRANTTFLMPSDRMLSKTLIPEKQVLEFLLRHSIPAPLFFEDLKRLPNGTLIPAYEPEYMIRVTNKGRKRFYVNNIQLVSPNICIAGDSFRCHGINGVLKREVSKRGTPISCSHAAPPPAAPGPLSSHVESPPPLLAASPIMSPSVSPPPEESDMGTQKSTSFNLQFRESYSIMVAFLILSVMRLWI